MDILQRYRALQNKVDVRKNDFSDFIRMLESKTSWLTSPASTRFHLNKEGGLLEHSVGVAETLLKFREALAPQISEESCVIVGLLHDIGKVGMPGKPRYLKNDNEWEIKNRGITYKINPKEVYMGLAARSLYLKLNIYLCLIPKPRRSCIMMASMLNQTRRWRTTRCHLRF